MNVPKGFSREQKYSNSYDEANIHTVITSTVMVLQASILMTTFIVIKHFPWPVDLIGLQLTNSGECQ